MAPAGTPGTRSLEAAIRQAIYKELGQLGSKWRVEATQDWKTFRTLWEDANMHQIYHTKLPKKSKVSYKALLLSIICSALDFCLNSVSRRQDPILGIFCLYAFHTGQPVQPPERIKMDPASWKRVIELQGEVSKLRFRNPRGARQALHLLKLMESSGAFIFCVSGYEQLRIIPTTSDSNVPAISKARDLLATSDSFNTSFQSSMEKLEAVYKRRIEPYRSSTSTWLPKNVIESIDSLAAQVEKIVKQDRSSFVSEAPVVPSPVTQEARAPSRSSRVIGGRAAAYDSLKAALSEMDKPKKSTQPVLSSVPSTSLLDLEAELLCDLNEGGENLLSKGVEFSDDESVEAKPTDEDSSKNNSSIILEQGIEFSDDESSGDGDLEKDLSSTVGKISSTNKKDTGSQCSSSSDSELDALEKELGTVATKKAFVAPKVAAVITKPKRSVAASKKRTVVRKPNSSKKRKLPAAVSESSSEDEELMALDRELQQGSKQDSVVKGAPRARKKTRRRISTAAASSAKDQKKAVEKPRRSAVDDPLSRILEESSSEDEALLALEKALVE